MAARPLHVLILDARKAHRAVLKKELIAFPSVQALAEVENLREMREALQKQQPDAIFGDPLIEPKSPLAWIDEVPRSIAVVLVAAQRRYALEAFEKRVLDYLLEPITSERLRLTLLRLTEWKGQHHATHRDKRTEDKVLIHTGHESQIIRSQTIICIRAEGNYTQLIFRDGVRKMVHRSLKQWKKLLPLASFFQVHRSLLVNLEQVNKLERRKEGGNLLYLTGIAEPVSVSRRLAPQLKRQLKSAKWEH